MHLGAKLLAMAASKAVMVTLATSKDIRKVSTKEISVLSEVISPTSPNKYILQMRNDNASKINIFAFVNSLDLSIAKTHAT